MLSTMQLIITLIIFACVGIVASVSWILMGLYRTKEELRELKQTILQNERDNRQEYQQSLAQFNDAVLNRMTDIATLQKNQFDSFAKQLNTTSQTHITHLENMRNTVEKRLQLLQDDNNKKLEQMRNTVDEKLHATLEKRLGESFKMVSDRLEQVHKGLGEMQTLAHGVGDLKKVLTNVKTRGIWGEIQLGNLLEQVLTPDQYDTNVKTKKGGNEYVEFAIKLPGKNNDMADPVWLPIDAKFPQDKYQQLVDAQELTDAVQVMQATKALESQLKLEARHIQEKYIDPPYSTDFGILFLPIEGLYAEVLRIPGLHDEIQRKYRVLIAGPTTLAALLNSLQMGFRTLAVEKRSSEVWTLLGIVKAEFGKFGVVLDKTQKKLQEASNTIEQAATRTRVIERQLKDVQTLPENESRSYISESVPI
jgi:DNA recombination protein RmuC